MLRFGLGDCSLNIPDRWCVCDGAAIDIVIAQNHEYSLEGTAAYLRELLEPCERDFVFLRIAFEGDIAAYQNCPYCPQGLGLSSYLVHE